MRATTPPEKSREKVIAEIYEAVLRPSRYDQLMDAWAAHLSAAIEELADLKNTSGMAERLVHDPGLEQHFDRALEMLERAGRNTGGEIAGSLSTIPHAAVLISPLAQIVEQSKSAGDVFGTPVTFAGIIERFDPDSASRLRSVLAGLVSAGPDQLLTVLTLPEAGDTVRHIAAIAVAADDGGGHNLLLQTLDIPWRDAIGDTLSSAFQLSPAEIDIVRDMAAGHSLNDIAKRRGRSTYTVRAQSKSIYRKTNTSTQADLMRLVSMLSQVSNPLPGEPVPGDTVFAENRMVKLPDGRSMEIHTQGPEDGRPVIFIHGMLDGTALTQHIDKLLTESGIRLICPVRPGFGNSDFAGARADIPNIYADDLAFLLQQWNIDTTVVIGHMAGSVYAYAAADKLQSRIKGIISVSGGVPITSIRQISAMAPRQRIIAYTARFAPALLPALLRTGISQIDSGDSEGFMRALYRDGSHDGEIVTDLGLADLVQAGYRFAVHQGYQGFEADAYQVTKDWSQTARTCPVRAIHLHGTHDPVVNIQSVRTFCRDYAAAELREHEDAGQLIFYQKPYAVLEAVEELLNTEPVNGKAAAIS